MGARDRRSRRVLATVLSGVAVAGAAVVGGASPAAAACGPGTSPPGNDGYNSAIVLSSGFGSGPNCYATAQLGEPTHAGQAAKASVWWSIQPTYKSAGRMFVATAGSDFDTRLAVYDTGHVLVQDLHRRAENDDVSSANKTSRVEVFNPTYQALNTAVDGYTRSGLTAVGSAIVSWGYMLTPFTSTTDMVGDLTQIYARRSPTASEGSAASTDYAGGRGRSPALLADRLLKNDSGMELNRSVARLYTAVLGRLPDTGGLEYWIGQRVAGVSLQEVARRMTGSQEFRTTYGTLNNTQFVDLVYQNVLGRSPDAAGRSYWVGQLNAGYARSKMMIGFSESSEFKTGSARLMNAAVIMRLGRASMTDTSLRAMVASSATIADFWAWAAEDPGYRSYVGTL